MERMFRLGVGKVMGILGRQSGMLVRRVLRERVGF